MGQNQSQLWAKIGMSFKQYHKYQNKSQLWVEMKANYKLK